MIRKNWFPPLQDTRYLLFPLFFTDSLMLSHSSRLSLLFFLFGRQNKHHQTLPPPLLSFSPCSTTSSLRLDWSHSHSSPRARLLTWTRKNETVSSTNAMTEKKFLRGKRNKDGEVNRGMGRSEFLNFFSESSTGILGIKAHFLLRRVLAHGDGFGVKLDG